MRKLTILVDMDDTIENLCEVWVSYLNKTYNTNVSLSDIREWDMTKAFHMLTRDQIYGALTDERLWEGVTPLPGAVDGLKKIIDDGHKVVVVTASHPDVVSIKFNMVLFKYFPYLTYKDVIITSQKQLVKGDVLIDDAPHNLEGGEYLKILFDAPHNKSYNSEAKFIPRVKTWGEIYEAIKYIAQYC